MSASPAWTPPSSRPHQSSRPSARRRSPPVTRSRSQATQALSAGGTNGVTPNDKDPSDTIMGDTFLERPLSEMRREISASRRRKAAARLGNARRSILCILFKTCLLLVGLLWLGQMIWKWSDSSRVNGSPRFALLDYEGRISEVEASFKKMMQMMSVQLEVVDSKIGSEIKTVVRGLKQVEDKGVLFEKEMKRLEARTEGLDDALAELKNMGFLSKQEFESFWNEMKKSRSLDGRAEGISLDDIQAFAREIVEKEIEKHAADGLGRVDYALASGGARVVRHSEPYLFGKAKNLIAVAKGRNRVHANAQKMLEPSFGEPGQCFALQGSTGFVEIRLRTGIIPEAVTLEHVSKNVAYDRSTAPRSCRVSAWFDGPEGDLANQSEKFLLTEFSYDLEKSNAQTFPVEMNNTSVVNLVRLEFLSNHGSSSFTSIYRFRVHGYEPSATEGMSAFVCDKRSGELKKLQKPCLDEKKAHEVEKMQSTQHHRSSPKVLRGLEASDSLQPLNAESSEWKNKAERRS